MNKYTVAYVIRNSSRHFLSPSTGWKDISNSRIFENFYEAMAVSERYTNAQIRPILLKARKR
jgi:hypothetical protein